ncbi:MAG: hypothetical protein ACJ788_08620 [Ktedonobacteraceae bacterium]
MLRDLYRVYLYVVFIAMLFFGVSGIQRILQILLAQTPLKSQYETAPSHSDVVQAVVYAAIAVFTAAVFGGLHYWLIRRDIRSDAGASSGAIRSFFLNFVEAINLPIAVGVGTFSISTFGIQNSYGTTGAISYAITTLGAVAFLEWERRRSQASPGAPIIFQRLHLYGVQLILLFILTASWLGTIGQLFDSLFFGGRGTHTTPCGGFTTCPGSGPNLLSLTLSTLTIVLFWLGYSYLSRNDTSSMIRRVLHLISLGYGVIFIIIGIYRGLELVLLALFKAPAGLSDFSGPFAEYDVLSPLSLGMLIVIAYALWLHQAARTQSPKEETTGSLIGQSIAAALFGVTFWYGCGLLILDLLERAAPSNTSLTTEGWTTAYAILLAGIPYIALNIFLLRRSEKLGIIAPLRGFVFVLLGGGILALAIGGATALYAYGTSLLGTPFDNWPYIAHGGTAAFAVGVAVVALYLWISRRENFFGSSIKQQTVATPPETQATIVAESTSPVTPTTTSEPHIEPTPMATPSSIAETVDALLAGKITRVEAIACIEALVKQRA